MGMRTTFGAVMAALLARDNLYPSDPEQKNMVKAEFLRGAATAFALCWRGEESSQCLEAAKGLNDQLKSPDQPNPRRQGQRTDLVDDRQRTNLRVQQAE